MGPSIIVRTAINYSILCSLVLPGYGCRPAGPETVSISGQVMLEGVPLPDGFIIIENPTLGLGASAPIQDGRFEFPKQVPKGPYKVAFQPLTGTPINPIPERTGKFRIPDQYKNSFTSNLEVDIQQSNSNLDFQLQAMPSKEKSTKKPDRKP